MDNTGSGFMGTVIHVSTEHKIGAVTYYVVSKQSEKAIETLNKKVEKLIKKDVWEIVAKQRL